jgi:DNA replication protein DnaC
MMAGARIESLEAGFDDQATSRLRVEREACRLCSDTGWEFIAGKGARRCRCRDEEIRTRNLEAAGIPNRYVHCALSNYQTSQANATQLHAFNYAYRLIADYPAEGRGLLFSGPPGVGKTHLGVGVLRGLAGKGIGCRFYEFGGLLKEIQKSYHAASQTAELDVLAPVYETEVLLLDELGAVKPTEWVCDMLRLIIGRRYNDRKMTIFTTNYGDERRHPAEETLEDRISSPLRSRLYEMCRTVRVDGEDWRRRFDD